MVIDQDGVLMIQNDGEEDQDNMIMIGVIVMLSTMLPPGATTSFPVA